eukprot:gb/GFBE01001296.1/.p1 GENE.gb/GFBE01001296.1/~~gb/GFBE01001296.1/.p1  ORF type:complete len:304 (+),score=68.32 gb/GFBE01001296.1/:1-912(+)
MKRKPGDNPEDGPPAKRKLDAMDAANRKLLAQLCAGGDFLTASRRTSIVRETLSCTASCPGCLALHKEGRKEKPPDVFARIQEVDHSFSEDAGCGGLGVIVHALANQQHLIDSKWHSKAVEHLWHVLDKVGEIPEAAKNGNSDDRVARLCEVIDVVAAAVGVRAYYRALGKKGLPELPPMPAAGKDEGPCFQRVVDYSSSGLHYDSHAWGPRLEDKDIKKDVYHSLGMVKSDPIKSVTAPYAPGSKWEPALKTSYDWFIWSQTAYPAMKDFFRLLSPFEGSVISRGDMETVAAGYTGNIHCKY